MPIKVSDPVPAGSASRVPWEECEETGDPGRMARLWLPGPFGGGQGSPMVAGGPQVCNGRESSDIACGQVTSAGDPPAVRPAAGLRDPGRFLASVRPPAAPQSSKGSRAPVISHLVRTTGMTPAAKNASKNRCKEKSAPSWMAHSAISSSIWILPVR